MNKKIIVFGMLSIGISTLSIAQQTSDSLKIETLDEVVITDSKFKLKRENSGKVITKITQKELQNLQGKSVAEIINNTAGIEINGTRSNAGQSLSYYIRGGRNRQVLILIDGIAVTDASHIGNDYDLRLLNADQVESIEILKGASSTLYGTGAATAVINITLKKASNNTGSIDLKSTFGTNQSQDDTNYEIENFRNSVSVNGTLNRFTYLGSFSHQYTNGLSAISNGIESDLFNTYHGYLKLGFLFSKAFQIKTYASFDRFKADFDDGFNFQDADNVAMTNQYRIGMSPEFNYNKGSLTFNVAFNHIEREIQSSFPTQFNANSIVGDLFNRYHFNDKFYTVLGLNAQQNTMEGLSIPFGGSVFAQDISPDVASFTNVDPYANVVYISDLGWQINTGFRLNNHSTYGSHLVYSLNPSYKKEVNFGYIKGLASYSTAFITPSLYQLFEPTYGNSDLKPEENRTFEVGLEVNMKDKATLSVVYFNRLEENFIDFIDLGSFQFQYNNIEDEFTASGIEIVADFALTKSLQLRANGTYTKTQDDLSLRIPEIKVNANLNYQWSPYTFMSLSYQFNDNRDDSFYNTSTFSNEIVTLKSYSLLDFYVSQKMLKTKLTLFANITNIFNEDYQELFGYSTRGRNINLGFTLNL